MHRVYVPPPAIVAPEAKEYVYSKASLVEVDVMAESHPLLHWPMKYPLRSTAASVGLKI